ncbi:MAG TPA: hypothetical protein VEA19_00560, partial [Actinomycetota bacterium]|nr:hypothetical protein [Actinomycetota bacterium]
MRASARMFLAALAAAALMVPAGSAGASATVDVTEATASGGTATVKGTVSFPAITTPQSVVTPDIQVGGQFAAQQVSDAAGLNLTDAKILPINGGLRFIWQVNSMPAQVPPEGVRYNWAV